MNSTEFNKEKIQGINIGLFEHLENLEMSYEVRAELNLFLHNLKLTKESLYNIEKSFKEENRPESANLVRLLQRLISEPQIFIKNE